eukprot:2474393-Lingulodinium_polyedra.AAC.1
MSRVASKGIDGLSARRAARDPFRRSWCWGRRSWLFVPRPGHLRVQGEKPDRARPAPMSRR